MNNTPPQIEDTKDPFNNPPSFVKELTNEQMRELYSQGTPPQTDIIEKFRKEWRCEHPNCGGNGICQRDKITEILRQALSQAKEDVRLKVEKLKKTDENKVKGYKITRAAQKDTEVFLPEHKGYNNAIEDVLALLTDKEIKV